ncbi:hypothetical protein [Thiorhodococcus fuscus]|uniref:DUF1043 family protein n=1 Tax=Thiorhodococcus fuscus TaxID=527200 RepID=A0ABW4YB24_9GAMM
MTAIELGSLILAVEFGFIAWGTLFLLLRRNRDQRNTDHDHASAVLEELQEQEVDRRDALSDLFANTYKLEGSELNSKVDEYVEREKAFYSAMLSLYLERDGAKLRDIPAELTKVLTPWAHITPSGMVDAGKVGSLVEEKAALALELDNTKQTLERLMDEYMAAFDKNEAPDGKAPDPEPEEEEEVFEETFEDIPEEPETQAPPKKEAEDEPQPDALEEVEDLDDVALSALGIEPDSPATDKQTTPPDQDAPAIEEEEEDIFGLPSAPAEEQPEEQPADDDEQADKPPTDADLDDAQAREELEGLADLFGTPSDKT